jgi:quinol monooxygenase YgiN
MHDDPVTILIHYRARAGKAEEAHDALAALIEIVVQQEDGCLGIQMHQGSDDPHAILLVEYWTDAATFTGPHMDTPHLRAFRERAPELFEGPPQTSFWRETVEALR